MIEQEIRKRFERAIKKQQCFAIYHIPEEKQIHLIGPTKEAFFFTASGIQSLNEQWGFVIAPFHISEKDPIILLQSNKEHLEVNWEFSTPPTYKKEKKDISPSYREKFQTFLSPLRERELKKLVLSRNITIESEQEHSPISLFLKACQTYSRSYVYLYYTPQTGVWLGSTPEILLSGEKNCWKTVALAGTQRLQNEDLPNHWNKKNSEEQQLVSDYLRKQLSTLNINPTESIPYSVRAGALAHLCTDFHFHFSDNTRLGELLHLLYPTPAVCGLPKEEAYRFILNNEGYNRRYYSGFIGWLHPRERTDLYVNLRCMQIEENRFTLYAGGGLLPSSILQEEWEETEDKLTTMRKLIK